MPNVQQLEKLNQPSCDDQPLSNSDLLSCKSGAKYDIIKSSDYSDLLNFFLKQCLTNSMNGVSPQKEILALLTSNHDDDHGKNHNSRDKQHNIDPMDCSSPTAQTPLYDHGNNSVNRSVSRRNSGSSRRIKLIEKRSSGMVCVDGGCQNCFTQHTPQWRYVHREKFCNACYMRIKRWVQGNLEGIKLPCRARGMISQHEEDESANLAEDIIRRALNGMRPH